MSYLDQITVGSTTYDLQDSDAQRKTITGSGVPTSSTVGEVGLHYFDTSAVAPPYEYVCTAVSGSTYTWMPAGYGEDGNPGIYYGSTQPSDPDIKVWVDPSGDADGGFLPAGGSTGQALLKASNDDFDAVWSTIKTIPNGGMIGQALVKASNSNFDITWGDISTLPSGGTIGQILVKTSDIDFATSWTSIPIILSSEIDIIMED